MGILTGLFFLCKILLDNDKKMDRDKLKLIVRNLELLVDSLKSEIYPDTPAYKFDDINLNELDYDEIYEDSE